jgi:leader peptidase (prepilin peptidase)/N-methyltransferase
VPGLVAAICGVYGLLIGSFLNVVIWRVPRKESIVTPASHCPGCDAKIAPHDNIPIASWLLLRGHCRNCGEPISARYPFIELFTAVMFTLVGLRFWDNWALPAYLLLTAALIALSVIDLETMTLPNAILFPVDAASVPLLAFASWLEGDWGAFGRALIAGAVAYAIFWVIWLVAPGGGFGKGDVKLAFLLGLFLGYLGWGYVFGGLFLGFVYGAVVGVALMAIGKAGRKTKIPFGPFLAAGAMTFILVGAPILDWYRHLGR